MTAPSVSWRSLQSAQIDADSPLREGELLAYRGNAINLREWLGKNYIPAANHDHDDRNSKAIDSVCSPNFLISACPESGGQTGWTASGFAVSGNDGFKSNGTAAHRIHQLVGIQTGYKGMFGAGGPWVFSFFVLASGGNLTSGELLFGGADGGVGSGNFMSGALGRLDFGVHNVTTSTWVRFWMAGTTTTASTDFRALWLIDAGGLNNSIILNGFMVYVGSRLLPFHYSPVTPESQEQYQNQAQNCPVWDQAVAIDNAVEITAGA